MKISLLNQDKESSLSSIHKNWLDFIMKLKEENDFNEKEKENDIDFLKEENEIKDYIEEIKILTQYNYIQSSTSNETIIKSDEDVLNNLINLDIEDLSHKNNKNSRTFNNDNKNIDNNSNSNNEFFNINESNNKNRNNKRRGNSASLYSQSDSFSKGQWVYDKLSENNSSKKEKQLFHFSSNKNKDRDKENILNSNYDNYFNDDRNSLASSENSVCISM